MRLSKRRDIIVSQKFVSEKLIQNLDPSNLDFLIFCLFDYVLSIPRLFDIDYFPIRAQFRIAMHAFTQ